MSGSRVRSGKVRGYPRLYVQQVRDASLEGVARLREKPSILGASRSLSSASARTTPEMTVFAMKLRVVQ